MPAWGTLYDYFRTWRNEGIWDEAMKSLLKQVRQKQGRDEEPSAAVIDSQSIKTSATNGTEKGFDKGKLIWGRKRHALVDTQGNLMEVKVTAASASDLAGSKKLLEPLKDIFPRMKLLWGDSHYGGTLIQWLDEHLGVESGNRAWLGHCPRCQYRDTQAQGQEILGRLSGSSQALGCRAELRLDHPVASPLPRS